jgi:phage terminase small subunit
MKLSSKQEKFCIAYIQTISATKAYKAAYNTSNMKPETINNKGYILLNNSKIRARISEICKPIFDNIGITKEQLLAETARIAVFDVRTVFDAKGQFKSVGQWDECIGAVIKSIKVIEYMVDGILVCEIKEVTFWDKNKALGTLFKILGGYKRKKKQKPENSMLLFVQRLMGHP